MLFLTYGVICRARFRPLLFTGNLNNILSFSRSLRSLPAVLSRLSWRGYVTLHLPG